MSPTDLTIPSSMISAIRVDLERFLTEAQRKGASPIDYPGATYLLGVIKGTGSSAHPSSSHSARPRRRTKALSHRAHDLARKALIKATRNDGRKRIPVLSQAPAVDMQDKEMSSDSDVPLSHRHGSAAPSSSLPPLTISTPAPESMAPLSDDESDSEVRC